MPECSKFIRGNPGRPPLIFLHGFLGCKEDWEEMIPHFEDNYHCIALDLPGHGGSPYCEDILSELRTEIHRRCSEKPILVGYSMGGRIALQLRQCAEKLIILSGHTGLKTQKEKEERLKSDAIWSEKLLKLPFEEFMAQWYAQPVFKKLMMQSLIKRRMQQSPQDLSRVLLQMSLSAQPHIDDFPCPTLFLYGEYDLKYRDLYSNLSETVSVRRVDKCSHAVHIDNAGLCAKQILNWLGD